MNGIFSMTRHIFHCYLTMTGWQFFDLQINSLASMSCQNVQGRFATNAYKICIYATYIQVPSKEHSSSRCMVYQGMATFLNQLQKRSTFHTSMVNYRNIRLQDQMWLHWMDRINFECDVSYQSTHIVKYETGFYGCSLCYGPDQTTTVSLWPPQSATYQSVCNSAQEASTTVAIVHVHVC